jgi:2,4-dienoyl-CoA reductase-like NADH-dependent reductase (Old Yellow Enzyme family)
MIKAKTGREFIITTRMNIFDGLQYPYGFGSDPQGSLDADYKEPLQLISELKEQGMGMVNITMGNPYYNPHVNRPFDKGGYAHPEHPLEGIARIVDGAGIIQKQIKDIAVVGSGYSYLRDLSVFLAAGTIESGKAKLVGFGREAFAYPDFAADVMEYGRLLKNKCCIACSKCTEMMRYGGVTGCVVKDPKTYAKIYADLKRQWNGGKSNEK